MPGPAPKIWRGYRNCSHCTRWRPVSDYPAYKNRTGFDTIKAECEVCKNQRERERYHSLPAEKKRERVRQTVIRSRERRRAILVEIERQRVELERREAQIISQQSRLEHMRRLRYRVNGNKVDFVPFRMWLLRQHRESGYDVQHLADQMGQDDSLVTKWLQGYRWEGLGRDPRPILSIKISTVDKVSIALGDPGLLRRLYPVD